jgi:hypothetical protein
MVLPSVFKAYVAIRSNRDHQKYHHTLFGGVLAWHCLHWLCFYRAPAFAGTAY